MQPCNCKICRENLAELVDGLYRKGVSKDFILSTLKNRHNLTTNKSTLSRHLNKSGVLAGEVPEIEPQREVVKNNYVNVDLNNLSLSRYNFDENSPESVIAYIQRVHLALYLKQLEIVANQLNQFHNGESDIEPTLSIINLKRLFDILDKTTGIEVTINQQKAIQTVEAMGYNLTTRLLEFN